MLTISEKIVAFLSPDRIEPAARTVGWVIPTSGGIIPAAVGVDIGCGMIAVETTLAASQLPDNLNTIETGIERRIPLGAGAENAKITSTARKRIEKLQVNHRKTTPEFQNYIRDLLLGARLRALESGRNDRSRHDRAFPSHAVRRGRPSARHHPQRINEAGPSGNPGSMGARAVHKWKISKPRCRVWHPACGRAGWMKYPAHKGYRPADGEQPRVGMWLMGIARKSLTQAGPPKSAGH
jgi:hypothetical protein